MCRKLAYIAHTTHPQDTPTHLQTPARQCTKTHFCVDIVIPDKQAKKGKENKQAHYIQ